MKSHTARPISEDLEELYAIAVREHGPQARSSRSIRKALNELQEPKRTTPGDPWREPNRTWHKSERPR